MLSISEALDEYERLRNVGRDPRVGPSDYGSCPRQLAYRVRGHEPGEQIENTRAATMGTLFWAGLGDFIARHCYGALIEVPVTVPGLDRPGASDLWWSGEGVLVDVKTVSGRAFEHRVTLGARDENVGQLETYALGINRWLRQAFELTSSEELQRQIADMVPVETLVLAYVNRDNGDVHEERWAYDEQTARQRVSWLVEQEQMIDEGMDMPRAEGAHLGAFPCDWCPFWRECWDVESTPADRSHASKYTDSDDKVEGWLERYFDAQQREAAAKREKAEAREWLVGISYASEQYKLSWSGGRVTYVDEIDYDELVILAQANGLEIPMREIEKRSPVTIRPKRVATD